MHSSLYFLAACILIILLPGCDSSDVDTSSSIVGRWSLVKVNGQDPVAGTILIYEFTNDTVRVESDLDCITLNSYSISGETLNITVTSVQGSQCGDNVGDTASFNITIEGGTLTLDASDFLGEDAIFEFMKI